jgi:transposase
VPERAHETRDLLRQFDLATKLIRAKLPLLADHLSQRISTPLGSDDREWRYTDDETQWTLGFVWQYDGSNVVVCNQNGPGKTWKIRFGEHECIVGESDGMWLLSAMLRHPGKELNVDQIWNEAGIPPRRAHPDLDDTRLQRCRRQLSDFQELFNEFAEDLDFVCGGHSHGYDGSDVASWRQHSVSKLIDDVDAVLASLKRSAIESHAARALKAKGIVLPRSDGSHAGNEDFATLVRKLRRCERFLADLQEFRRQKESQTSAQVTEQGMADDAFRKRNLVLRSVTAAIDEISNKNAFLGGYFRRAFRTTNLRFMLDVGSKWNVVCGKGLTEFSTDAA